MLRIFWLIYNLMNVCIKFITKSPLLKTKKIYKNVLFFLQKKIDKYPLTNKQANKYKKRFFLHKKISSLREIWHKLQVDIFYKWQTKKPEKICYLILCFVIDVVAVDSGRKALLAFLRQLVYLAFKLDVVKFLAVKLLLLGAFLGAAAPEEIF